MIVETSLTDRWAPTLHAARPWKPPASRTVVVAPHPDDESLSSGGLVAYQRSRGISVVVVAVTDGEASYDARGDSVLAATRRAEQNSALGVLGVDRGSIRRLGLPDGDVAKSESELRERLTALLCPGDLVVTTWNHDVHPDHEACGRAALGASMTVPVMLVFSLFWTWHEDDDSAIDGTQLLALELDEPTHVAKQIAIGRHASQFGVGSDVDPILDDRVIEPAGWPCEYFVPGAGIVASPLTESRTWV